MAISEVISPSDIQTQIKALQHLHALALSRYVLFYSLDLYDEVVVALRPPNDAFLVSNGYVVTLRPVAEFQPKTWRVEADVVDVEMASKRAEFTRWLADVQERLFASFEK